MRETALSGPTSFPARKSGPDPVSLAGLVVAVGIAAALLPANAWALELARFGGHLGFGYSQLFVQKDNQANQPSASPSNGSLSVGGGIEYSVTPDFMVGGDIGFSMLGSRTIDTATATANLDYSVLEIAVLGTWNPHWGPIGRISAGPMFASARAELATSGGGLAFTGYAVEKGAPGVALDVTLTKPSSTAPVRAGFQVGYHAAYLPSETWNMVTGKLLILY